MSKRSFEAINYMLRPNKNVERKLIVATLKKLQPQFDIPKFRYVGFGSMWFSDFVLVHRYLNICDLITIENQKSRKKRVEFNKPFACIEVRMDEAAIALGDVLDGKQSIVWLDYDGPLKSAMTGDLETAVGEMVSGSMLLVSVNASVDQLRNQKLQGEEVEANVYLADICENEELLNSELRLTANEFPALAAQILHDRIKSAVLEKKPGCEYVPIWSYRYADGVTMVTVGGMIADHMDRDKLRASDASTFAAATGRELFDIDLPVLTEKEKRALDKLLPSEEGLDPRRLEFELRPSEVAAYQRFYLEYPIFGELVG
ncbi:hypothetical protein BJ123_13026 [Rhodopseudomonas thermotolerans]|uniref:Uncharacterized protein n=2 Tax=Rhodopseudomonas TaxID=1073 RepID=A0A336K4T5_9BRAD|nr:MULTISPECIES: O-methyltransferase [Rhodopseudomonas]RED25793.1 hypothetical protein BJ125_13026 [Rhodopseudomonas pentothenatexigens]REF90422.1 hypothetical protein BJ123_13026 [Rhodopseudomonas thermotolerans]SSW93121.1 hypothetical protein SAMN05892882_13026 [Rhodopseudomonas pentothenatexigens]